MNIINKILLSIASIFGYSALSAMPLEQILTSNQIHSAQDLARYKGQPIKLTFTLDGCGACKSLKQTTHNPRGTILSARSNELNAKYHVTKFPTVVVLDANGNVVRTAVGSVDARTALES